MNRKSLSIALGLVLGCMSVPLTAAAQDTYRDRDNYTYERDHRGDYRGDWRGGMSDAAIQNRVQRALNRELGDDADRIYVRVANNDVFLSGRVDSDRDRWRARRVANNVRGVDDVNTDRLRVRRY